MRNNRGFTLLELLLYSGISATILGIALSFQLTFFKATASTNFVDDMNNATSDIDMQLLADIRTAKSIITPAADNTSGDVAVMTDASDQTYSYSLIAGALYRQITLPAAGPLVRITPPEVRVVSINFSRINNSFSDGLRYTVNIAHTPRANALDSSLSISHTNSGATLR